MRASGLLAAPAPRQGRSGRRAGRPAQGSRGSKQQREGVELLQGDYASYTEGFDSRELEEARVALDQSDDRVA